MRSPDRPTSCGAAFARRRRVRLAVALGLLVAAVALHHVRRTFIRAFFVDGQSKAAPQLVSAPPADEVDEVPRVRVVLVDGLGETPVGSVPHLDRLCQEGLDLRVDVGFPTVSLPVQHVLWTGLTQLQSGIMYRIDPLPAPPAASILARVPDSQAVAESHPEIVGSFGFAQAWPPMAAAEFDDSTWRGQGFADAATRAVAGPARLVFVHILRVDEAGHAHGAASRVYADAAAWADDLIGMLVDVHREPTTRWVVLSDHGHRPAGGHGGAERSIRIVRACIFGDVPTVEAGARMIHLVDLHRLLADSLGLEPVRESAGRSLSIALAHPQPDATLPRPELLRWLWAAVWLSMGAAATLWASRGRMKGLPWWLLVAYVSVVFVQGTPTLSNPMVYPPLGRDMLVAALPGLAMLAFSDLRVYADESTRRRVVGHLSLVAGSTLAALTLSGALTWWAGGRQDPPLMPIWTAHASLLLTLMMSSAAATAALVAIRAAKRAGDRT